MNRWVSSLVFITCLCLMQACEQPVDINLGKYQDKIVVHALLENGKSPEIYVMLSSSYLQDQNQEEPAIQFVRDAKVYLTSNGLKHQLTLQSKMEKQQLTTFNSGIGFDSMLVYYYSSSLVINSGQTYSLKIDRGPDEVTSETNVPPQVKIDSAKTVRTVYKYQGYTDTVHAIRVYFKDIPGRNNYYYYNVKYNEWHYNIDFDTLTGQLIVTDSFLVHHDENIYDLISDEGQDGKTLVFSFRPNIMADNLHLQDTILMNLRVISTTKATYDYFKSLNEQKSTQYSPFSEPVFVKSNITGGLGIFSSGAASQKYTIKFITGRK